MKDLVSRRSMLAGMGYAAAYGSVASQVLSAARAAEAAAQTAAPAAAASQETVLSMIFLASVKSKFDARKYTAKHLPLLKKSYGDSVSRIELRTSVGDARGIPSDVLATTTIYIVDLPGFIQKMSASAPEINKDLADSSTGQVIAQADRVLLASGQPRSEVLASSQVFSTFYRDKPDATFDAAYYTDTYIPKLRSLYGDAIGRIEINRGLVQGGQKPQIVAASHLFIRERSAFDDADRASLAVMMKLDPQFTNIISPMWADLRVTAFV